MEQANWHPYNTSNGKRSEPSQFLNTHGPILPANNQCPDTIDPALLSLKPQGDILDDGTSQTATRVFSEAGPVLPATPEPQNPLGPALSEDEPSSQSDLELSTFFNFLDDTKGQSPDIGVGLVLSTNTTPQGSLDPALYGSGPSSHPNLDHPVPEGNEPPTVRIDAPKGRKEGDPLQGSCNNKCKGDLLGPHECERRERKLSIKCLGCRAGLFTTKHSFNRHCQTKHGLGKRLYCTFPECKKIGSNGFSRKDNLTQHLRSVHGENIPTTEVRFGSGRARGGV